MNHLAIDSATEILSVALRADTARGAARYVSVRDAGLRHTHRLMPLVDQLLQEAGLGLPEIDLVSCTRGPGSFTGLRIGMATAKGLATAIAGARELAQPPLLSVPTLDVMARRVPPLAALVVPVIDGKKGRFYGAAYLRGARLTDDLDLTADELLEHAVTAVASATGLPALGASVDGVLVTGPHAAGFVAQTSVSGSDTPTLVVDPGARAGWAATLLDLAEERLPESGYDSADQGPEYVRGSDAELSRRS